MKLLTYTSWLVITNKGLQVTWKKLTSLWLYYHILPSCYINELIDSVDRFSNLQYKFRKL